jgi:glycosyltransferase involved in cell wall biosynthesis
MCISFFFPSPIDYLRDQFNKPIGGAETAILRLGEALRSIDIKVEIINSEKGVFKYSNVLIVTRFPLAVLKYRPYFKGVYFFSPDDINHGSFAPLLNPANLALFNQAVDGVISISNYQYQRFVTLGINETKLLQSRYGVQVSDFPKRSVIPQPICIYTSSPKRGLDMLTLIWPKVYQLVPQARLWICSSMATYRKDDSPYKSLYDQLRSLPNTNYFGSVKWSLLVRALCEARVFLYPNTFNETASVATLEAVAAGCAVVTTSTGALPESAKDNILIAPRADVLSYINAFAKWTVRLLTDDQLFQIISERNQLYAQIYDWALIAKEWKRMLRL